MTCRTTTNHTKHVDNRRVQNNTLSHCYPFIGTNCMVRVCHIFVPNLVKLKIIYFLLELTSLCNWSHLLAVNMSLLYNCKLSLIVGLISVTASFVKANAAITIASSKTSTTRSRTTYWNIKIICISYLLVFTRAFVRLEVEFFGRNPTVTS